MPLSKISNWLLTTVPGIIILGVIGSILARLGLKFAFFLWRKYGSPRILKIAYSYASGFLIGRYLAKKYGTEEKKDSLLLLIVIFTIDLMTSTAITIIVLISTVLFFLFLGLKSRVILIFMTVVSLLCLHWWLSSVLFFAGILPEDLLKELVNIKRRQKAVAKEIEETAKKERKEQKRKELK